MRRIVHAQHQAGQPGSANLHPQQGAVMVSRFALVLDSNAEADPANWRASQVAATPAAVTREHDGHFIVIPRKATDRRITSVMATHRTTGAVEPAGLYEIT
jgi:hypothetical protein